MDDPQLLETFYRHMQSILENDQDTYRDTVIDEMTLYEWWVTPHRIEGIPFHEFMMDVNARKGSVFGVEGKPGAQTRFDYANLKVQQFGDAAVISYSLLVTSNPDDNVQVVSHNESRVLVKVDGKWKVIHVHKSPDWNAPHLPPSDRGHD
ncbi:MAG: nuclear transport factor 2 family protein [Anaerolineales bacterium]